MCMYDVALWKYVSISGIFLELGLLAADTTVHSSRVLFASHCSLSYNQITVKFVQFYTLYLSSKTL